MTLRDRVAGLLRRWAQKLDGRHTLAVGFSGSLRLDERSQKDCIRVGLEAIFRAACMEAMFEVNERALARVRPDLWEEMP